MRTGNLWLMTAGVAVMLGVGITACSKPAEEAQNGGETTKPAASEPAANAAAETRAEVAFSGGHQTDPRDMGRPVILVAAGLGVPPEVFRETFTHVTPAAAGREPEQEQVQKNKQALMQGLGPYGVTNDLLDTVSNYRYPPGRGNMWKNRPAKGYATVKDGKVTEIVISDAGAGYSSAPEVSVAGMPGVKAKATIWYGKDLKKNGSVEKVELVGPPTTRGQ